MHVHTGVNISIWRRIYPHPPLACATAVLPTRRCTMPIWRGGVLSRVIRALNKTYYIQRAEQHYDLRPRSSTLQPPPGTRTPMSCDSSVRYDPGSMATRDMRTTAAWLRMRLTTNDYTRAPNTNGWRRREYPYSSLQPVCLLPACGRARVSRRTCSIAAGTRHKYLQRSMVCAVVYHASCFAG